MYEHLVSVLELQATSSVMYAMYTCTRIDTQWVTVRRVWHKYMQLANPHVPEAEAHFVLAALI